MERKKRKKESLEELVKTDLEAHMRQNFNKEHLVVKSTGVKGEFICIEVEVLYIYISLQTWKCYYFLFTFMSSLQ